MCCSRRFYTVRRVGEGAIHFEGDGIGAARFDWAGSESDLGTMVRGEIERSVGSAVEILGVRWFDGEGREVTGGEVVVVGFRRVSE